MPTESKVRSVTCLDEAVKGSDVISVREGRVLLGSESAKPADVFQGRIVSRVGESNNVASMKFC